MQQGEQAGRGRSAARSGCCTKRVAPLPQPGRPRSDATKAFAKNSARSQSCRFASASSENTAARSEWAEKSSSAAGDRRTSSCSDACRDTGNRRAGWWRTERQPAADPTAAMPSAPAAGLRQVVSPVRIALGRGLFRPRPGAGNQERAPLPSQKSRLKHHPMVPSSS
jgi:hypothetical protein